VREGEGVFDIIVLVDNRWSRFGSAESRDCSDLDCGDTLLIFIFAALRGLDWRTNVDDGRRLLGDTGAGDEAINNSLDLCSSCLPRSISTSQSISSKSSSLSATWAIRCIGSSSGKSKSASGHSSRVWAGAGIVIMSGSNRGAQGEGRESSELR
jgi:hypothetical protein